MYTITTEQYKKRIIHTVEEAQRVIIATMIAHNLELHDVHEMKELYELAKEFDIDLNSIKRIDGNCPINEPYRFTF